MALRITGGSFRGRKIAFHGGRIRPTASRIRQAIFDILGDIGGLRFCDLYAGSGAIGIEALSRGADYVEFVEADKRASASIVKNLQNLGIESNVARIRSMHVSNWARKFDTRFDIIFADPPYIDKVMDEIDSIHEEVVAHIEEGGFFILQLPKNRTPNVKFSESRNFGDDRLHFCYI